MHKLLFLFLLLLSPFYYEGSPEDNPPIASNLVVNKQQQEIPVPKNVYVRTYQSIGGGIITFPYEFGVRHRYKIIGIEDILSIGLTP